MGVMSFALTFSHFFRSDLARTLMTTFSRGLVYLQRDPQAGEGRFPRYSS